MNNTFYWFDFETFGANPMKDRPAQFAGIRTDENLNIIGEPLMIYCKPSPDFLPAPEACLVTGITPQTALEKGMPEANFFKAIEKELAQPNTCAVGYNSLRFDDEVVRHGFYRNFLPPYNREWQNGNSRWDLMDVSRMTAALRPDGINWPTKEDGSPSFKLEDLCAANGINTENAHDAMADVYATIEWAKTIRKAQPRLFDYAFKMRKKDAIADLINTSTHGLFLHVSGMLGSKHQYVGVMMPITVHPNNKNSVICVDVTQSIQGLTELEVEDIYERIFTKTDELPEGLERLPVKEVHLNKSPTVAPLNTLTPETAERLSINLAFCKKQHDDLLPVIDIAAEKLMSIYEHRDFEEVTNPDWRLYAGGFISNADAGQRARVSRMSWDELCDTPISFEDDYMGRLLFRYRARNSVESLTEDEQAQWHEWRCAQFGDIEAYMERLDELENAPTATGADWAVLNELREYVHQLCAGCDNLSQV